MTEDTKGTGPPGDASVDDLRYVPWVRLDSGDPEYLRGYELGRIQAKLEAATDAPIHQLMRRSNAEMLNRLTKATGRTYHAEIVDAQWMVVEINPETPAHPEL